MPSSLKKFLVFLPVMVLGLFYLADHYEVWSRFARGNRFLLLAGSYILLYGWILTEVLARRQQGAWDIAVQSSYFLYVFMVLTLTGYFILFRELSTHQWFEKMAHRVERNDHVNLELFKIFRIYHLSHTQILGNLVMLLPFGIYFPLLYKKLSHFLFVVLAAIFVSVVIELLQLATRYRSADVDDVLLNTLGACIGYGFYSLGRLFLTRQKPVVPLAA